MAYRPSRLPGRRQFVAERPVAGAQTQRRTEATKYQRMPLTNITGDYDGHTD